MKDRVDIISTGNLNLTENKLVEHGYGRPRRGLESRFLAALVAIVSAVACGGGGVGGGGTRSQQVQVAVQFSSNTLAFGNQLLTVASAAQTVTVTNASSLAVAFTSVGLAGDN